MYLHTSDFTSVDANIMFRVRTNKRQDDTIIFWPLELFPCLLDITDKPYDFNDAMYRYYTDAYQAANSEGSN